ncbi:hypothetical protein GUJ93_ZPchr0006g43052 [Zizania palustris]|uniref:Phosphate transporter n=1 Tax=Zizania palustris TaxID=103762 RepID=A0A8J5VHQ9_ZIZPA|nr:hypothetical protein GUJ93_ZPchr0006g43052 [Zizania palustris]
MSISVVIALFAALTVPLAMRSLVFHGTNKMKELAYLTLLSGFYMAWNIGANDVANAMGTSVGSGALTLRQAVLTAAVLGFCKFHENVNVASSYGWPVSTTHCIVGAMVGFGIAFGGVNAVFWSSLARVSSSWVISPLMGAAVSFIVYKCIRRVRLQLQLHQLQFLLVFTTISFAAFLLSKTFSIAILQALACGAVGALIVNRVIQKQLGDLLSSEAEKIASTNKTNVQQVGFFSDITGPTGAQLQIVYGVFGYMQVLSACFMSFVHGGNDVSNAIGPLAAALSILQGVASSAEIVMPTEVLAWGGFGIVAGVIATIGKKITELTPTRGFAAASVVLFAPKLGLPISATHTLVGAVMGVGFARGFNRVRAETVHEIVASWVVTIPVGAMLSIFYTLLLTKILAYIM